MRLAVRAACAVLAAALAPAHARAEPLLANGLQLGDTVGEVQADAPSAIALTVYRDDLALVTETRTVTLPGGPVRLRFDGVQDRMIETSAVLQGLGLDAERDFTYDGLSPRSLLWRSLGAGVTRVTAPVGFPRAHSGERREHGRLSAVGDGIVLGFDDGHSEALGCSGLPERLLFDRVPDGLRAKPALTTLLRRADAGTRTITLSYLVTGMAWQADYTLVLEPDATHATLSAWLTLRNQGDQGVQDARVGVVAGDLSRVGDGSIERAAQRAAARNCWPMATTSDLPPRASLRYEKDAMMAMPPPPPPPAAEPMLARAAAVEMVATAARRESLGDYQLYHLPNATDVLAAQTKQVMLLPPRRIEVERVYRHDAGQLGAAPIATPRPATILLRARNDEAHGLGEPLPGGTVRVYAPHPELGPLYTVQGETEDTAVDTPWRVETGSSAAVRVRPILRARDRSEHWFDAGATLRDDVAFELTNATTQAQTIEVAQTPIGDDLRISGASDAWRMQDGEPTFRITLAPGATHTLRYRVRYDIRD